MFTSPPTPTPPGVAPLSGLATDARVFKLAPVALTYVPKLEAPPAPAPTPAVVPPFPPEPTAIGTTRPPDRPGTRLRAYPPPAPPPLGKPLTEANEPEPPPHSSTSTCVT